MCCQAARLSDQSALSTTTGRVLHSHTQKSRRMDFGFCCCCCLHAMKEIK